MTDTEKFILKGEETKDAVLTILAVLDDKSYKFSNAALNAAKMFLNEESHFKLENAVQKVETLFAKSAKNAPKSDNTPKPTVKSVKKK